MPIKTRHKSSLSLFLSLDPNPGKQKAYFAANLVLDPNVCTRDRGQQKQQQQQQQFSSSSFDQSFLSISDDEDDEAKADS